MNIVFLVLFTFSSIAFGQSNSGSSLLNIDCPQADETLGISNMRTFRELASDCSIRSLENMREGRGRLSSYFEGNSGLKSLDELGLGGFNLTRFEATSKSEFCNCLSNPMIQARVPPKAMFMYSEKNIDSGVSETFKASLKHLFLNVTKFKNMNLSKDMHNKSKTMCSPSSIVESVKRSNCPGASFDEKVKKIFGDGGVDSYPAEVSKDYLTLKEGTNSCITKQEFLRLRSANKTSNKAMGIAKDAISIHDVFHTDYANFDSVQFPKLLSYDPLFSLGYQYSSFNISLREILKRKYDKGKIDNVYETIYDDPEVQESAFNAIELNCDEMKKNLNSFLCGNIDAKPDVKNTSLIIDSNLNLGLLGLKFDEIQPVKDYYTGMLACSSESYQSPQKTAFNKFLESNMLANRVIPDLISDSADSEYTKFNKTFCNGRKDFSMMSNDLAGMMKDFFDSKKPGIDLRSFFAKNDIRTLLNLNINPDSRPNFTRVVVENGVTKLPEIGSEEMSENLSTVKKKLIEAGLTDGEVQQLFGIIEMQTNARNAEIRYVTQQYRQMHPEMKEISPVQVDAMLRGYSVDNFRLPKTYEANVDNLSQVQNLYIDEMTRRQERFYTDTPAPSAAGVVPPTVAQANTIKEKTAQSKVPETSAPTDKTAETPKEPTVAAKTTNTGASLTVTSTGSGYVPSSSSTSSYSSTTTGSSNGGSSYSGSSNPSYDDTDYSTTSSRASSKSYSSDVSDEIKRLQADIDKSRREFEESSRKLFGNTGGKSLAGKNSFGSQPSGYKYPKNLPVKKQNGDYYQPEAQGSELSSASGSNDKEAQTDSVASSGGGGGISGGEGKAAGRGGPVSFGGGGIGGGGGSASSGRGPASAGNAATSFIANAAVFEFNRYLPQSIFDVVGSIDKVIMLLGLEGKSFKTIEAIEETDPTTGKVIIKYYERTFDFVPIGKFKKFKDLFSTKEDRANAFKEYFSFPRTKENMGLSKQYSLATRQLSKEEVSHSYVLNIQNYILSDDEIRDTIKEAMEKLK